ncbi:DUF2806 domain-containing protein [Rhizobium hidalgonense]|uniref:DUF2806 domain-containing protein n=1 Tax=Rhizobium hidalgonense TaxID=1538159 RepID=UPI0028718045|nr:DUF2806 domain-containing protein [Rhizobium hidalgonense]MDR9811915.1 DUF2806 domain-containing protein [Rhizobium hidalgonense]
MTDPLNTDVSLTAQVKENGLIISGKSRALSALDRLCGNALDLVNPYLEKSIEKRRATKDMEVAAILSLSRATSQLIESDQLLLERAAQKQVNKLLREQHNRDEVARAAYDYLKVEPWFESDTDPGEINPDWMNRFEAHAENASTVEMQHLWGKILAGEIMHPGDFSLSTLRTVSEIDHVTALLFQKYASICINAKSLPQKNAESSEFNDLLALQDAGLITEVGGFWQDEIPLAEKGVLRYPIEAPDPTQSYLVIAELRSAESQKCGIPIAMLTRQGSELARIIPKDAYAAAIRLAAAIDDQCKSISVVRGQIHSNGRFTTLAQAEVIKAAPPPPAA